MPPTPCRFRPRPASAIPCSKPSSRLPAPKSGDATAPLKAMLVDSWYDAYLGVVVLVRIIDGVLKKGQTIRMMGTNAKYSCRPHRRVQAQDADGR